MQRIKLLLDAFKLHFMVVYTKSLAGKKHAEHEEAYVDLGQYFNSFRDLQEPRCTKYSSF
jgi:hypothetical protein